MPANIEVHDWVPQLAILRQADVLVTHAGAGGSQEGLASATPMVAVPQAVDQFGNADMLASLGLARRLPMEDATAGGLRDAVRALAADPEVARRLEEIGLSMLLEGGTRRAGDLIEAELPPSDWAEGVRGRRKGERAEVSRYEGSSTIDRRCALRRPGGEPSPG